MHKTPSLLVSNLAFAWLCPYSYEYVQNQFLTDHIPSQAEPDPYGKGQALPD